MTTTGSRPPDATDARPPGSRGSAPDGAPVPSVGTDADARAALTDPALVRWYRPDPSDPWAPSAPPHPSAPSGAEGVLARWTTAVLPGGCLRPALRTALGSSAVDRVAEAQTRLAHHLLDGAVRAGGMDAVGGYATPLALLAAAEVLGLHGPPLRVVAEHQLADPGRTLADLHGPADGVPGPVARALSTATGNATGHGLLAALRRGVADGAVAPHDVGPFACLLLFALVDNVVAFVAGAVAALAEDADATRALRDADIPTRRAVVEELLRRDGPVRSIRLIATRATACGAVRLAAGDPLDVLVGAAGHDPARYPEPQRLDPSRATTDHLAFGWGPGYCVGARLARREALVALTVLTSRVTLVGPARLGAPRPGPAATRGYTRVDVDVVARDG